LAGILSPVENVSVAKSTCVHINIRCDHRFVGGLRVRRS
jgi:hypothetical protein